jgi:hypothetical protein
MRNPFSSKLPRNFGLQPLPETPDGVPVSVPERALLEMLSDVGVHQGIEEARNIMEGARSLRPDVHKHVRVQSATQFAILVSPRTV